jgi:hypothetical protein
MTKPNSTESASSSLRLTESICDLDLFRVYRVAILLTASARRAEEAVTRAIESLDLNAMTSHGLSEATIKAATEKETSFEDAVLLPKTWAFCRPSFKTLRNCRRRCGSHSSCVYCWLCLGIRPRDSSIWRPAPLTRRLP